MIYFSFLKCERGWVGPKSSVLGWVRRISYIHEYEQYDIILED